MTNITDEQKREVKAFINNLSTVYTDTLSKVWEVLGLDTASEQKPPHTRLKEPNSKELQDV